MTPRITLSHTPVLPLPPPPSCLSAAAKSVFHPERPTRKDDGGVLCKWRCCVVFSWLAVMLPIAIAIVYGVWVAVTVTPIEIGLGLCLVVPGAIFLFLGIALWRANDWTLPRRACCSGVVMLLVLGALLCVAFELAVVFHGTWSYVSSTWVFMGKWGSRRQPQLATTCLWLCSPQCCYTCVQA